MTDVGRTEAGPEARDAARAIVEAWRAQMRGSYVWQDYVTDLESRIAAALARPAAPAAPVFDAAPDGSCLHCGCPASQHAAVTGTCRAHWDAPCSGTTRGLVAPAPRVAAPAAPEDDAGRGGIYRALLPLLASYECDEPHWDEDSAGYYRMTGHRAMLARCLDEIDALTAALAEARRLWVVEEGVEGEGTYTLAICASREVAEAIVAGLGPHRPNVGVEAIEPVTDAAAWLKDEETR